MIGPFNFPVLGAPKPSQNHGKMPLRCMIIWQIMSLGSFKDVFRRSIFVLGIKSFAIVTNAAKCECPLLLPLVVRVVQEAHRFQQTIQ